MLQRNLPLLNPLIFYTFLKWTFQPVGCSIQYTEGARGIQKQSKFDVSFYLVTLGVPKLQPGSSLQQSHRRGVIEKLWNKALVAVSTRDSMITSSVKYRKLQLEWICLFALCMERYVEPLPT